MVNVSETGRQNIRRCRPVWCLHKIQTKPDTQMSGRRTKCSIKKENAIVVIKNF